MHYKEEILGIALEAKVKVNCITNFLSPFPWLDYSRLFELSAWQSKPLGQLKQADDPITSITRGGKTDLPFACPRIVSLRLHVISCPPVQPKPLHPRYLQLRSAQSSRMPLMVPRRMHTKSRKGCRECKRRRVKVRVLEPSHHPGWPLELTTGRRFPAPSTLSDSAAIDLNQSASMRLSARPLHLVPRKPES